jgi:hypothetical protein
MNESKDEILKTKTKMPGSDSDVNYGLFGKLRNIFGRVI